MPQCHFFNAIVSLSSSSALHPLTLSRMQMKIYFFLLAFALLESGCLAMPQVDDVIPEDYDVFPEDTLLSITDMDPTEFSSPIMGPEAVPEIVRKGEVADGATGGNWIVGLGALRAARQTTKKAVRDSKAEAQFKAEHPHRGRG